MYDWSGVNYIWLVWFEIFNPCVLMSTVGCMLFVRGRISAVRMSPYICLLSTVGYKKLAVC